VAMLTSRELNITDRPRLIKKRFFVGEFKNRNKKLKEDVIIKPLIKMKK
jgi:hypothetical protein